jgi:hypothetical protein
MLARSLSLSLALSLSLSSRLVSSVTCGTGVRRDPRRGQHPRRRLTLHAATDDITGGALGVGRWRARGGGAHGGALGPHERDAALLAAMLAARSRVSGPCDVM